MDVLKRDWLSGGFVPRHGGIGGFLPRLKPSPPASHPPQPQSVARNPRIGKSLDHSSRRVQKSGRAGTSSAREPRTGQADQSPRRAQKSGRAGTSSAREPRTGQAVARHRATSGMLDSMGARKAPGPPTSAPACRPTTRENARGLLCEHRLDQPTAAAADMTRRRVRDSAGPMAALRAAKNIGLRAEVEHCAATVLQTVLRTRRPKNQLHLHRAAMVIQGAIRLRNDARNRRARVASMDDGSREEHKAKARQRELENMKNRFHERFREWEMEQAQKQQQDSRNQQHDQAQLTNEPQSAADEARDLLPAAREAAMIRNRERLRQEHGHRRKRREQVLRQQQIKQTWDEINDARIKSVESAHKHHVVQEKRSVRRLNHQILSILLESWRVYTEVRRRLERSNVAAMIPSSMVAIEKQIEWRKSQLKHNSEPSARCSVDGKTAPSEKPCSADSHSPRDAGLLNSAMHVFQGKDRQAFTRGFLVWKQWCMCLNTDGIAAKSQSKLPGLFRFYLAAARGFDFASVSSSVTTADAQFTAEMDQPVSSGTGALTLCEEKPMPVLEETAEDGGGDDETGDTIPNLPRLGLLQGHGLELLIEEQSASPRLGRYSEKTQGTSPLSARTPVERKLATYQLPSLALVRTSVRAQPYLPCSRSKIPAAASCRYLTSWGLASRESRGLYFRYLKYHPRLGQ